MEEGKIIAEARGEVAKTCYVELPPVMHAA